MSIKDIKNTYYNCISYAPKLCHGRNKKDAN